MNSPVTGKPLSRRICSNRACLTHGFIRLNPLTQVPTLPVLKSKAARKEIRLDDRRHYAAGLALLTLELQRRGQQKMMQQYDGS